MMKVKSAMLRKDTIDMLKPKAIYLCHDNPTLLSNVFDAASRQALEEKLCLLPGIVTPENIENRRQELCDVEYAFSSWGMLELSQEEIKTYLPALRCVFYAAGSVQYFARPFLESGVRVFSAWAANAVPVAEYTVSQIILANKGFYQAARGIHSPTAYSAKGDFCRSFPGAYRTKVGIIGAGMIGRLVIQMLRSYEVDILVFDPFLPDDRAAELGVEKCGLETLFSECQTISNHLANNEQTRGMLNYNCFSKMQANAVFLNTGRGAQVVEADLVRALTEQPGRTAVLDVTDPEPPEEGHPFYTLENVFLTPHIAGSLGSEIARMGRYMVEECQKVLENRPTQYEVSLKMLETMA